MAISIRESFTNAKTKYSSSVEPPDPSVHFYHSQYGPIWYLRIVYKVRDRFTFIKFENLLIQLFLKATLLFCHNIII